MYDVIVVGGGPAGMTAALYALRNGKTALVLEKHGFGGQITYSPKVENYPGTMQMSGNEYADKFIEQIMAQGADVELEKVIAVSDENGIKIVKTEDGNSYEGKTVILATGVKHRMLGLDRENDFVGEGISFCAVCDGDFYKDQVVCVIGGGNSALQEAILLAGKCSKVIMLQDLPTFTGEQKLQDILFANKNVDSYVNQKINHLIIENDKLVGVNTTDKTSGETKDFKCDGIFVAIGLIPENDNFKNLANLNQYGYFDTNEFCETKTPGIFVAGDCRSKFIRQLTTAVADGAVAALAACRYINEH